MSEADEVDFGKTLHEATDADAAVIIAERGPKGAICEAIAQLDDPAVDGWGDETNDAIVSWARRLLVAAYDVIVAGEVVP